ncbi:hypothetical protein RhoFasB10_00919 [Rhodococcus sp. B10]|uniref:DUF6924 domain-containing protein n=2 Tax=Mycobacteriales TaxID=85007 RepID=A0A177YH34_9NOCA|nr:hypothetical protein [Rhodococcus sp. B10]OAK54823.1 hypothetical protein A3K89_05775 [Rhodococcus kyotonensis]
MGRSISGTVHRPDGSWQLVRHVPDDTWRYETQQNEPVFIETPTDRWSRDADGTMVHAVKSPNTMYAIMGIGSPSLLLRAYDTFPPRTTHGFDDQRFVDPSAPRESSVRGRPGWEVTARDHHMNEAVTYVFDAELGVALRWQRGEEWMELSDPTLDETFDDNLFRWTGPSRPAEDEIAKHQREHEKRQRELASIPQAIPSWLPLTTHVQSLSGNHRTGELTLSIGGNAPQFTLRRWVTAIGEPALEWPSDSTPERYRQSIGDWTYEIRSYNEIDHDDCLRIVDSIVHVDPPDRDPAEIVAELEAEEHDRHEAEVLATLGTGRILTNHLKGESLFIRTDFSDDDAWRAIATAAMAPVPQGNDVEFSAYLTCIDNPEYDGMTVDDLLGAIGEPPPYYAFLVDSETVGNPEMPIVVVDTGPGDPDRPRGRTFRVIPSQMSGVENNLSIANMDFESFADSVDDDGVFRGFPEPPRPVEEVTTREIADWIAGDLHSEALKELHAVLDGRKYRYPVQLFDVELSEVHAQVRDAHPGNQRGLLGFDEYLRATESGGPALRGYAPAHSASWHFVLDRDSHRPIAAYRIEYQPYTPPPEEDGVPRTPRFEVPFVNTEPVSESHLTDDDDLVDPEVVKRAVLAEAARLHDGAELSGGNPLPQRIPRLPGYRIGCHVRIDGEHAFYVAIVTDIHDEFLVIEVPNTGLRIVGPGEP